MSHTYTINVYASPSDAGTVSGGGTFEAYTTISIEATPNPGWRFKEWRDQSSTGGVVSTDNPCLVHLTVDQSVYAIFERITYTVSASVSPDGSGMVTGTGSYSSGASVTLEAIPYTNYEFVGWMDGSTTISTSASYTFTVTGNRTLTAVFKQKLRLWVGVSGKARKGTAMWVGVNGKARKVVGAWVGVNGKARRFL